MSRMAATRTPQLEALSMGVNCPACRATTDEPCQARSGSASKAPHGRRIDRAVNLYLASK